MMNLEKEIQKKLKEVPNFELLKNLLNYAPYDETEKKHKETIVKFIVENKSNSFFRENLKGHITASAYIFSKDYSKLLLTHHKKLNRWIQLGGHSDGETNPLKVAYKEGMEESGILSIVAKDNTIFDVDAHCIPFHQKTNTPEHFHYDIRFVFTTEDGNFIISEESINLKWFTIEEVRELNNMLKDFDRILHKWKNLKKELSADSFKQQ